MKATFCEVKGFTEALADYLPDRSFAEVQQELMENPDAGDVMPGCGGLRKFRVPDSRRRKGKRGGARIIYLYIPRARRFYLLDIYSKDEKADLAPNEKKYLRQLAENLKEVATREFQDPGE